MENKMLKTADGEGKKPVKIDLKKLFRLGVLGALLLTGAVSVGADPVVGKVIGDAIVNWNLKEYFIDLSDINRSDKILRINISNAMWRKLDMYIQDGSLIMFDDISYDEHVLYPDRVGKMQIIAIINQNGDIIKISDLTKDKIDYPYAFKPENQAFLDKYIADQQGQR